MAKSSGGGFVVPTRDLLILADQKLTSGVLIEKGKKAGHMLSGPALRFLHDSWFGEEVRTLAEAFSSGKEDVTSLMSQWIKTHPGVKVAASAPKLGKTTTKKLAGAKPRLSVPGFKSFTTKPGSTESRKVGNFTVTFYESSSRVSKAALPGREVPVSISADRAVKAMTELRAMPSSMVARASGCGTCGVCGGCGACALCGEMNALAPGAAAVAATAAANLWPEPSRGPRPSRGESQFVRSRVVTDPDTHHVDEEVRRSRVLYDPRPLRKRFVRRLLRALPAARAALGMPRFRVDYADCQMTASNDGDFFDVHTDSGVELRRMISYVYFFHLEPAGFSGGELRLFEAGAGDVFYFLRRHQAVRPRSNRLVLFPSTLLHEILPLHCRRRQFADSRFTVNGWIYSR